MDEAAPQAATGDDSARNVASLGEITAEALRQTFPNWRIFPGDGVWWAVRGGWQAWEGPKSLLLCALTAPDLTMLAERLCLQEWLESLDEEALAAVYQGALAGNVQ